MTYIVLETDWLYVEKCPCIRSAECKPGGCKMASGDLVRVKLI